MAVQSFWDIVEPESSTPPIYDPFGNGEKGLSVIATIALSVNTAVGGGQIAFVTAADVIRTIYGSPVLPITYYLRLNGGAYGAGNTDPENELLQFNCDDLGAIDCFVKIIDADTEEWCEVPFQVTLGDGCTICAP